MEITIDRIGNVTVVRTELMALRRRAQRSLPPRASSDRCMSHPILEASPPPRQSHSRLKPEETDGSHTSGTLRLVQHDLQDHPNRELVLRDPIKTAGPSGEPSGRSDTLAILSAREETDQLADISLLVADRNNRGPVRGSGHARGSGVNEVARGLQQLALTLQRSRRR